MNDFTNLLDLLETQGSVSAQVTAKRILMNAHKAAIAQARKEERERCNQYLINVYEVYAGMEGVPIAETATEDYLLHVIKEMVDEINEGRAAILEATHE